MRLGVTLGFRVQQNVGAPAMLHLQAMAVLGEGVLVEHPSFRVHELCELLREIDKLADPLVKLRLLDFQVLECQHAVVAWVPSLCSR